METKKEFTTLLRKGDHLKSFDVMAEYRHLFLHRDIRDSSSLRYDRSFFWCISLPFGCGTSAFWFVNFLNLMVKYLREEVGVRVLPYIDDFLIAAFEGKVRTDFDCEKISRVVSDLLLKLGLERHEEKSISGRGSAMLAYLGVTWDTGAMEFTDTRKKSYKMRALVNDLLSK